MAHSVTSVLKFIFKVEYLYGKASLLDVMSKFPL